MKKNNSEKIVAGIVIEGQKKGRILSFLTANIKLKEKLDSGVYSGEAYFFKKKYRCAVFIPENGRILEAHILGFEGNLYGEKIKVRIIKKIRDIMKFNSDDCLMRQIRKDIEVIKKI